MQVFYQCDRENSCKDSPSCQTDCFHTKNKLHAEKRPCSAFSLSENGDLWESIQANVKKPVQTKSVGKNANYRKSQGEK